MEEENITNETVVDNSEVSSTPEVETTNSTVEPNTPDESVNTSETIKSETVGTGKKEYSDLERAQYSFRKQYSKQKAKYEAQIADMRKSFEERLERLENPDKYRPKYRDDFKTDDEFINHLVQQKFEEQWKSTLENYEKQEKERQEQEELVNSYKSRAEESINKFFTTEEAKNDYHTKVQDALDKGLGELIDSDEQLAQYIMMSPNGAKLMYELATNFDTVKDLFENSTPMDRQFKIRTLEQKLISTPPPVAPVAPVEEVKKETPKPIGRPGVEKETNGLDDIFKSSQSVLDYLSKF